MYAAYHTCRRGAPKAGTPVEGAGYGATGGRDQEDDDEDDKIGKQSGGEIVGIETPQSMTCAARIALPS